MKHKNFYIKVIILASLLLFNISCSKQESPSLESSEARTQRELERLEACSAVNFNKGVLLHRNSILLFKCTKWDEEFPEMFQAMKRIQGSSWDHIMAPIDKEFVENLNRRDKFFSNIKELDSKNGLDDLSRVLVALNETNFFDSVSLMLKCIDNSNEERCLERQQNIPSKKSIKNILRIAETSPETIERVANLASHMQKAIGENQEALRIEINKFKSEPAFIEYRLRLIDSLANKLRSGLSANDREFLSTIFLTGSKQNDNPWIYNWIQDEKMNRSKFRDLIQYPILVNPEFINEVRGLEKAYNENLSCSIKSTAVPNELVDFNFKNYLFEYIDVLINRNQKSYYEFAASTTLGLKLSSEVCLELEKNKYKVDFLKMMTSVSEFLGEKKYYDLIKFILSNTEMKADQDKDLFESLYFFDFFTGEIFQNANLLNQHILKKSSEFYPTLFDLIRKLPPEAYLDIGEVAQSVMHEQNYPQARGVADFWNFFSEVEKNFLFNFIDRHFEGDTQFLVLLDFYSKTLIDFKEAQPVFKESWIGSESLEEMSYLSLQDFFENFSGPKTLADFKRFFGRDQILKVLEVISNGNNVNSIAKQELRYKFSGEYVLRSRQERYKFQVTFNSDSADGHDSRPVLECMKKFSEIENGFYQLIRKLPEACSKISDQYVAYRLFDWMNSIESTYKRFNDTTGSAQDSLLSDRGFFSPMMLNSNLGFTKVLDTTLGEIGSVLPTKNGINYLLSSARYHFEEKKAVEVIDNNLKWLVSWFNVSPEENLIHRNAVLKKLSSDYNFSNLSKVFEDSSILLKRYGNWTDKKNKKSEKYDPNFDCEKVINSFVSLHPCPSKEIVKKHTNNIVKYLTTTWEKDQFSPIVYLMKALKPGEGLDIPLYGKNTTKYRMTLKETLKYMYDTSDVALPVNRRKIEYVNSAGKKSFEAVTTLERVEVVIRDVRFDNNYLGAAFLNAVTQADDYNDEVSKRKKLLATCLKIPGVRCTRPMSNDDLRMARNSLEAFDSLLDVNNGRGLEAKFNYGNYLKTFEQTLVASSAKKAQEVQLIPLKDEFLVKHNGRLLSEMTMMNMWSNTARVLRDRVGRTREEFEKFINSDAFNRVDRALLYGFELTETGPSAERILKKIQQVPAGETQSALDQVIDWAASLNYEESRLAEETFAKLLVTVSYLGSPRFVFGVDSIDQTINQRFEKNNLMQLFLSLEKIVDHYPVLKNSFPSEMKLVNALRPLNVALTFINESLESTNDPENNHAYLLLNNVFSALDAFMFETLVDPKIANPSEKKVTGLDLVLNFMKNPKDVKQTYFLIEQNYDYLKELHENNSQWFKSFGENLLRVSSSKNVNMSAMRDYIAFTTKNVVCLNERLDNCSANYHFDEPATLVRYLVHRPENKESYLRIASRKVLVENFDQLNLMIADLYPALRIKEVKPPLKLD